MNYYKIIYIILIINLINIIKCNKDINKCCSDSNKIIISDNTLNCIENENNQQQKNFNNENSLKNHELDKLKNFKNCSLKYLIDKITVNLKIIENNSCYGYLKNQSHIIVYCENNRKSRLESKNIKANQIIAILNKCCDTEELYDYNLGICDENRSGISLSKQFKKFHKIAFNQRQKIVCDIDKDEIVAIYKLNFTDIDFDSDSIKIKKNEIKINRLSYCLDNSNNNELILHICSPSGNICKKNFCIRKCCKYGQYYKTGKCVDGLKIIRPDFINGHTDLYKGK